MPLRTGSWTLATGNWHLTLSMKIRVRVIEPVLADRAEEIELEGVVERFRLMLDPGRYVQDLAFADGDLLAGDEEPQRALEDVGHLLALVRMHRHERALFQIDLREHFALARDEFARDHFGDLLQRDFVPAVEPDRVRAQREYPLKTRIIAEDADSRGSRDADCRGILRFHGTRILAGYSGPTRRGLSRITWISRDADPRGLPRVQETRIVADYLDFTRRGSSRITQGPGDADCRG